MKKLWSFSLSTIKTHWPKIAYSLFVLIFWILPYWPDWIPSFLPEARTIEMWGAIFLLPAAILSSRLRGAGETFEGAIDVLVESVVAVATAFLLVGIERQMSAPPLKPLIEKIPELSLVTILVFAVQIVSKSTSAVKYAKEQIEEQVGKLQDGLVRVEGASTKLEGASSTVAGASGAVTEASGKIAGQLTTLQNLSGELNKAAALMQSSAKQVAEARYAAVAARVLGLKYQDRLYVRGPDGEPISDQVLAPVTERALDSIQAWIQTGLHIETARSAGPRGRETWWRLMEAYHREEVFDVSQQEIATNVQSCPTQQLRRVAAPIS